MRELEIGRTPLREAVKRLALESLVEIRPRRGTYVTDVGTSPTTSTSPRSEPSSREPADQLVLRFVRILFFQASYQFQCVTFRSGHCSLPSLSHRCGSETPWASPTFEKRVNKAVKVPVAQHEFDASCAYR